LRLVVFDLDGTLIDSRRDLADAANALIVERGGRPLPVEAIAGMVGEGAPLLVRRVLKATTPLYDGTREALEALALRAALAVLTNKPQRPTDRILEGLGIAPFFQWSVGGDTPYGRKPDPAGLNHLMSAAGTDPGDTVMVGDSAIDLRTARAAGTRICLVRYGFGFQTAAGELAGDELVADSPSRLPTIL
jgi:phosphoglycolate phosphatase